MVNNLIYQISFLFLATSIAQAINVGGNAFLEFQSDHSGIKILFEAVTPTAETDSTFTSSGGSYLIEIQSGVYNIIYSMEGFESVNIDSQGIYSNTTLSDIILLNYIYLSGQIYGTLIKEAHYIVTGDIKIANDNILVIEPGAEVRFDGSYKLIVNGILIASGTETDSIIFTRHRDAEDSKWMGIRFENGTENSEYSTIKYCIIEYSKNLYDGGGAIRYYNYKNDLIISNNLLINNESSGYGSAIAIFYGSPNISCNVIRNNYTNGLGGAIYCEGSSPSIINNLIIDNYTASTSSSSEDCGGICCRSASPFIINNTISDNNTGRDGLGGAIDCIHPSSPVIKNNTITNNSNYGIYVRSSTPIISYNNVWENTEGNFYNCPQWVGDIVMVNTNGDSCDAYMNIQLDPKFANSNNNDYHLSDYSPCIGNGTLEGSPITDIEGNPRPNPPGTNPDIGAYECDLDVAVPIDPVTPSWIKVIYPNGGERLAVGTPYTIAWDTDEPIGNVKIDISTTGGSTWWDVMQGASTPNDGNYLYTPVVENISDHCLFRITSIENPAVTDISDEEFRIVSLSKPTCHAKEIPSYLAEPQIDGVLDDPVWTTISEVDSLLFGGFYLAWTLPWTNYTDNLVTWKACWSSGTNCLYVAVEVKDDIQGDYDNEPNDPAPYLPFNDESLEFFLDGDHQGDFYADRYDLAQHWRVSGKNVRNLTDYPHVNEHSVYIEGDFITATHYSSQGGNWTCEAKIKIYDMFKSIPKNLQIGDTLGFELWYNDTDNEKYSSQYYVRDHQTGWAYAGPAYDDASFFGDIILTEGDNSSITVLSPNGGEDIGCSTTITWSSVGTSANVRLEYYCNGVWNTIINSTTDDGSYIWNITTNMVCSSKIKIIDAVNTSCWDMSDDFFDIHCEGLCEPPYIKAGDVEGAPGMDIQVPIHMKGNTKLVDALGFEFNYCADKLHLLEVVKGSLTTDFNFFQFEETEPGHVTIGGFHTTPIPLHSDGVIAIIKLHIDACALGDSCILTISGLVDDLIGMNICNGTFSRIPCHLGDVNNDGSLTPGDALCAFQIYLHGGTVPSGTACDNECALFSADVNCTPDGITPGDALFIFQGYLGGKTLPLDCKPTALPKENNDLTMTIASAEGKPGEEVFFTIGIERPESIQAFGLDLGYPAELLTFVGVRATGVTEKWEVLCALVNVDGVVTIGGFDPSIQEDLDNKLVDIVFKVKDDADGIGDLWLFNVTDDLAMAECHPGRFSTAAEGIRRLGGLDIPDAYRLEQNYPNPFNMDTEIMYQLPEAGFVTVTIYNSVGHQIRSLVNQHQEPGKYAARWDGKDDQGNEIPSGVYIYHIKIGSFSDSKKMILIK